MVSTSTKKYHHGDLPQALLDEGKALLSEKGPDKLSLRELARRLGVSAMAPYRHYTDKESLLAAIATTGFRKLTEQLETAERGRAPGCSPLLQGGITYVRFALDQPALFRLMFSAGRPSGDYPELAEARDASFDALIRYIEPDADSARRIARARGCWSLVHGLALLLLDGLLRIPEGVKTDDWLLEIISHSSALHTYEPEIRR